MVYLCPNIEIDMGIEHIKKRQKELDNIIYFWNSFMELNDSIPFSKEACKDIQTKVSSRMAFLERSIRDHEAELLKSKNT